MDLEENFSEIEGRGHWTWFHLDFHIQYLLWTPLASQHQTSIWAALPLLLAGGFGVPFQATCSDLQGFKAGPKNAQEKVVTVKGTKDTPCLGLDFQCMQGPTVQWLGAPGQIINRSNGEGEGKEKTLSNTRLALSANATPSNNWLQLPCFRW